MQDVRTDSVVNTAHPLGDDVVKALASMRKHERDEVKRTQQVAVLARPTPDERQAWFSGAGIEARPHLTELGRTQAKRITTADIASVANWFDVVPVAFDHVIPVDHHFWWARTDWTHPSAYRAALDQTGLHFTGKLTYDANALFPFSFGATAAFELHFDRLPPSPSGRWRSEPFVELFGGLLGWTGPYDLFDGDSWCKVWMIRRQTLFQWGFGPTGPVPILRGQATDVRQLINEENAHRTHRHPLGGFHAMPAVDFGNLTPQSVWAHLEVRFDVQLEGNSFLWLDPEVNLRTFQWPATAT